MDLSSSVIENEVIPRKIFQTWNTKNLPPKMREVTDNLINLHPTFEYFLFDENDRREFIKIHFDSDVLNAYDNLIPGSYKADLWRYCVLYVEGGIYMDFKFQCEKNFDFTQLLDKEYFVLEKPSNDYEHLNLEQNINYIKKPDYFYRHMRWAKVMGVLTGLIICKPHNKILLRCINKIVEHCRNDYYGYDDLYPTGPGLLGEEYFKEGNYNTKLNEFTLFFMSNSRGILHLPTNRKIISQYPEYRQEQKECIKNGTCTESYGVLYKKKQIYKSNLYKNKNKIKNAIYKYLL